MHYSIANKYYFKYNGRKITLILMNATEILQDDLERAERRKSKPFRREWAILSVATLSFKSELLQDNFVLPLVGTNILQLVHKEHNNIYVTEKEQVIVSGKSTPDILNCPPMMLLKLY